MANLSMCRQVLHFLLVFCGAQFAQFFGEGLDLINTTISGDLGQYLLSVTSNTFLVAAIQDIFSTGVMQDS
jgi:hypothetical protein